MNFLANPRHTHRKYFRRKWNKQKHRLFNKLHLKSWSPMMHFAPGSSSPRFISSFPSTSLFPTLSISPLHSSCPWSSVKPQYLLLSPGLHLLLNPEGPFQSTGNATPLFSSVSSVQFSRSVVSDSLRPHGLQHTRPPCPPPTPGVYSNSCPLSRWCHPTISSSAISFSSCLQSFPASGSFQMSQFFASGGQRWPLFRLPLWLQ